MTVTNHQLKQQEVIDQIENQISSQALHFSTVSPVDDYENDPRICLTSVHLPHKVLLDQVQKILIEPLQKIEPDFYYYPSDSLHMTIKNVRMIDNPPPLLVKMRFKELEKYSLKLFLNTISLMFFSIDYCFFQTTWL